MHKKYRIISSKKLINKTNQKNFAYKAIKDRKMDNEEEKIWEKGQHSLLVKNLEGWEDPLEKRRINR